MVWPTVTGMRLPLIYLALFRISNKHGPGISKFVYFWGRVAAVCTRSVLTKLACQCVKANSGSEVSNGSGILHCGWVGSEGEALLNKCRQTPLISLC